MGAPEGDIAQKLGSVDARLAWLENELTELKPSLAQRIERLEKELPQKKTVGELLLDLLSQVAVPIISGLVILILGYAIKDSVDQALARQQLQLAYASEMQPLIEQMSKPGASLAEIESAALMLATFGDHAAVPLVNQLQHEGSLRALGAETGLRAMALGEPARACLVLERMIDNRTRLYGWETHQRAIRLLGDLRCESAMESLQAYQRLLVGMDDEALLPRYRAILRRDSAPGRDSIALIRETLQRSLEVLEPSPRP